MPIDAERSDSRFGSATLRLALMLACRLTTSDRENDCGIGGGTHIGSSANSTAVVKSADAARAVVTVGGVACSCACTAKLPRSDALSPTLTFPTESHTLGASRYSGSDATYVSGMVHCTFTVAEHGPEIDPLIGFGTVIVPVNGAPLTVPAQMSVGGKNDVV